MILQEHIAFAVLFLGVFIVAVGTLTLSRVYQGNLRNGLKWCIILVLLWVIGVFLVYSAFPGSSVSDDRYVAAARNSVVPKRLRPNLIATAARWSCLSSFIRLFLHRPVL